MSALKTRMTFPWRSMILCAWQGLACQEPYEPYKGSSTPSSQVGQGQSAAGPAGNSNPPKTPATDSSAPGSMPSAAPAPLTEAQALSVIRGSCIYAGCHADAPTLMASPNIVSQLQNNVMPPTNQQRYTIRAQDRQALIAFLQTKAGPQP